MKFKKLLAVGLLASIGFSSVLSATTISENKTIEQQVEALNPIKATILLDDYTVYNSLGGESIFDVNRDYGKEVGIAIELLNDAELDLAVYINDKLYDTFQINATDNYLFLPITLTESSQIRVVETVQGEEGATISYKVRQFIENWSLIAQNVAEDNADRPSLLLEDFTVFDVLGGESLFDINPTYGKEVGLSVELHNDAEVDLEVYVNDRLYETFQMNANNNYHCFFFTVDEPSQIKVVENVRDGKAATLSYIAQQR